MGKVVRFPKCHARASMGSGSSEGKRSGRKSDTGIPVRCATAETSLPSILRAPVSQRVTVGRETPTASANSPCEIPRVRRYSVKAESALMPMSVPNRHSGCQAESVSSVRDMGDLMSYCTGMVTKARSPGLFIAERAQPLGLKDGDIAKACGVYRETVNRWRNGKRYPDPDKMPLLAKALKCSNPLDLFLPPGKMVVIIDVPGYESPVDGPPVREPHRLRQRHA